MPLNLTRGTRLTRSQRRIMRRLDRYSYDSPFVTNNSQIKIELLGLEEAGLVECQWSEDLGKAILFAWLPCPECVRGIRLNDHSIGGIVPFASCPSCGRYEHDLAAAGAIDLVAPVEALELDVDQERSFGFRDERLTNVYNYLIHQVGGRSL